MYCQPGQTARLGSERSLVRIQPPRQSALMKINHTDIEDIDFYLERNGIEPNVSDKLIVQICHDVFETKYNIRNTKKPRDRKYVYGFQCEIIRRDLLKILYRRNNNSATGIKPGFVYAISNPAWPDYVKVGSAIDVYDRLNSYQTSSPNRDFKLLAYFFCQDRFSKEREIQTTFNFHRNGEWCQTTEEEIVKIFSREKKKAKIVVPDSILRKYVDVNGNIIQQTVKVSV